MPTKYEVHNQLTGMLEEAATWEEALDLQARLKSEYMASIEEVFAITILTQNQDGSWTQGLANENGNLIPPVNPLNEYLVNNA